jgi:hypothetical protein
MQRYTIFFMAVCTAVQLTHASGSSKQGWHMPDAVCTVWALDDGRKTRLRHVEHWQQYRILYNVASCWLYLKEYINDARYHEGQTENLFLLVQYFGKIEKLWKEYSNMR